MINCILKTLLISVFLVCLGISSVFAGSMDELLINGVRNNDLNKVQTALSNGADVNCVASGTTPLLAAIDTKNVAMVNFLLKNGANPNLQLNFWNMDKRPLIQAVRITNNLKMVQLLVDAGAKVNDTDNYGATPLMYAISIPPNIELVQYLIAKGSDVNQANKAGTTPLMIAAMSELGWSEYAKEKVMAAKILLKAGADPSKKDIHNKTALQHAIEANFNPMINLLLPISPK